MPYITKQGAYLCTPCVREAMAQERERSPGLYYGVTITPDDLEMDKYDGPTEACSACNEERR